VAEQTITVDVTLGSICLSVRFDSAHRDGSVAFNSRAE